MASPSGWRAPLPERSTRRPSRHGFLSESARSAKVLSGRRCRDAFATDSDCDRKGRDHGSGGETARHQSAPLSEEFLISVSTPLGELQDAKAETLHRLSSQNESGQEINHSTRRWITSDSGVRALSRSRRWKGEKYGINLGRSRGPALGCLEEILRGTGPGRRAPSTLPLGTGSRSVGQHPSLSRQDLIYLEPLCQTPSSTRMQNGQQINPCKDAALSRTSRAELSLHADAAHSSEHTTLPSHA
ncbi:hypothetical protein SKAU_G00349890 [Synaphobranchus kaupii]|uniref:Uncharacterized protein n=1 Tax=Synaphobranchus kaupii TaxID=118154 RepID=A0A9Q1EKA1_SYNKA|nr:hypothetical protein SKAU_G00349890 [Synaphobranchus kaupii]